MSGEREALGASLVSGEREALGASLVSGSSLLPSSLLFLPLLPLSLLSAYIFEYSLYVCMYVCMYISFPISLLSGIVPLFSNPLNR